mmetsp:Transcript_58390/g.68180  ORF Transcript_58390/g.68180 Transcript_58390/m.68180 type:complete len:225 (-) Transcript_58390:72-746(-)
MIPSDIRQFLPVGSYARVCIEIIPGCQNLHRSIHQIHGDNLVHNICWMGMFVIFPHAVHHLAIRRQHPIRKPESITLGSNGLTRRRPIIQQSAQSLCRKLRIEDAFPPHYRGTTSILVHPGSHIGILGRHIDTVSFASVGILRGVLAEHIPSPFLRPSLEPVHSSVRIMDPSKTYGSSRNCGGGDGTLPRSVGFVNHSECGFSCDTACVGQLRDDSKGCWQGCQ